MKKAIWTCVLAVLLAAGCLEIEADEAGGTIEVSGGKVDVDRAILQMIRDRQWTHESAGARTSNSSFVRKGIGVSTREGLILPAGHREESSQGWVQARTTDGKLVRFDMSRSTGKPQTVRITVEDGASVSTAEVTAELTRLLQEQVRPRRTGDPLTMRVQSLTPRADDPNVYAGRWTAVGDWAYPGRHIRFEIRGDDGTVRSHSLYFDGPAPWAIGGGAQRAVTFQVQRHVGVMTFEGQRGRSSGSGEVVFEPNTPYVNELAGLVNSRPGWDDLLRLFFLDLDLNYSHRMKGVLGDELTLATLVTLGSGHVSPQYVQGVRDAGYTFSADEIVKLSAYHIGPDVLQGFARAGYDVSVDEFIKIHGYHLRVEDFVAFREAGYDFSIDQMIKARGYHLPVEMARTLHEGGLTYSLDELIKLNSYHVPPDYIVAFKQGGYDLSVDEVIKARSYHVDVDDAIRLRKAGYNVSLNDLIKLGSYHVPSEYITAFIDGGYDPSVDDIIKARGYHIDVADAVRLRKAGYSFSLDELIKLQSYHVPVDFMVKVSDPAYEAFSADELIAFRQRQIDADAISKIRAARRRAEP